MLCCFVTVTAFRSRESKHFALQTKERFQKKIDFPDIASKISRFVAAETAEKWPDAGM